MSGLRRGQRLPLRRCGGDCDAVTRSQVLDYLAGNGPMTRYRENKYCALAGFYRSCDQPGLRRFLAAARQ